MTIIICKRCHQRIVIDPNVKDFVHICNSNIKTLDEEDKLVVGNWEDYTGSGTVNSADVRYAGVVNKLFGQRASIEGEDVKDLTKRGKRKSTHRVRQHLEYIEIK